MKVRNLLTESGNASAVFLGYRDELLGEMVEEAKYESVRGLILEIAEVVYKGYFEKVSGKNIILVPMPTNRRHVRERAMDHMDLVVREIERLSDGRAQRVRLLARMSDTVQTGASEAMRRRQAKEAVGMNQNFLMKDGRVQPKYRDKRVFLIDDVWTTGASLTEAGKMLKNAGVDNLTLVAIAKSRARRSPTLRHGEIY